MNAWGLTLGRDDVLTLLEDQRGSLARFTPQRLAHEDVPRPPPGKVTFLWQIPPQGVALPPIAVVRAGETTDFLAWAATYVPKFRPFTAFIRVIEPAELVQTATRTSLNLGNVTSAVAGLTIAEALASAQRPPPLRELSTLACEATFFFTYARGLAVGLESDRTIRLESDWNKLRSLTKQQNREIPHHTVQDIAGLLLYLITGRTQRKLPPALLAASQELAERGDISTPTWIDLVADSHELHYAPIEMRANRERRVLFLDNLFRFDIPEDPALQFALGYLVSLFDSGANINLQLLPRSPQRASLLLWHGLTAGLLRDNQIDGLAGGLGQRIIRDILHPDTIFDVPRADLSFAELAILLGGDRPIDDFRVGSPISMTVEIAPLVNAVVRWPSNRSSEHALSSSALATEPDRTAPQQEALFETPRYTENDRDHLLAELGEAIERVRLLYQRLRATPLDTPPRRKYSQRGRR